MSAIGRLSMDQGSHIILQASLKAKAAFSSLLVSAQKVQFWRTTVPAVNSKLNEDLELTPLWSQTSQTAVLCGVAVVVSLAALALCIVHGDIKTLIWSSLPVLVLLLGIGWFWYELLTLKARVQQQLDVAVSDLQQKHLAEVLALTKQLQQTEYKYSQIKAMLARTPGTLRGLASERHQHQNVPATGRSLTLMPAAIIGSDGAMLHETELAEAKAECERLRGENSALLHRLQEATTLAALSKPDSQVQRPQTSSAAVSTASLDNLPMTNGALHAEYTVPPGASPAGVPSHIHSTTQLHRQDGNVAGLGRLQDGSSVAFATREAAGQDVADIFSKWKQHSSEVQTAASTSGSEELESPLFVSSAVLSAGALPLVAALPPSHGRLVPSSPPPAAAACSGVEVEQQAMWRYLEAAAQVADVSAVECGGVSSRSPAAPPNLQCADQVSVSCAEHLTQPAVQQTSMPIAEHASNLSAKQDELPVVEHLSASAFTSATSAAANSAAADHVGCQGVDKIAGTEAEPAVDSWRHAAGCEALKPAPCSQQVDATTPLLGPIWHASVAELVNAQANSVAISDGACRIAVE